MSQIENAVTSSSKRIY
ncbi:RepB family protein, partial [Salmonella enterica]